MALANFANLKTAIETWMLRDDARLTGSTADLIALAGSRINKRVHLNRFEADAPLTGTVDDRELTLPSDFKAPISLHLTTFGERRYMREYVTGVSPSMSRSNYSGIPTGWTINNDNIDLNRPCDQAHTFVFRYRQLIVLDASTTTNWLMTNHPEVYLSASLVEGYALTKNTSQGKIWEARWQQAIAELDELNMLQTTRVEAVVDQALQVNPGGAWNINSGGFG